MKDQDFFDFLDDNGIAHKEQGRSIVLQSCPSCNSNNWKVALIRHRDSERKRFYGKCYRNDCRWNSYDYLIAMGIDKDEVRELHGYGATKADPDDELLDFLADLMPPERIPKPEYKPQKVSTEKFFHIEDWPDHPAAKYAISRGYVSKLHDQIMIDPETNSVVFLCKENNIVCGWQKRFVVPFNPKMKTLNPSSDIWQKSKHVVEYAGPGDLCIVEGPSTCMSAQAFGFHGVCTFGSAISQRQLELVLQISIRTGKNIAVAFDTDFAGVCGYYRIKNYMARRNIDVYRIKPEIGNDLNDSWKAGKKYLIVEDQDDNSLMPPLAGIFEELYK